MFFRSICTTFETLLESTLVRENSKIFWFSSHLFVPLRLYSKVGCISEMKINSNLFCISLDLHYLCRQIKIIKV